MPSAQHKERRQWKIFVQQQADMSVTRKLIRSSFGLVVMTAAVTISLAAPSAHTRISQVTWAVDVAPIVRTRCAGCHHDGGFGPMPLTTYDQARKAAKAIREEVLAGRMPPWQAAPGYGDFANDASLSPLEIELLTSWADGNTPLGDAAKQVDNGSDVARLPRSTSFDLPVVQTSGGAVHSEIDTGLSSNQWITGWQFAPGNPSLVEGAELRIGDDALVGSWTPIESAVNLPTGVGQSLPVDARLSIDVRYRRSSEIQTDRSRLTLYLSDRPLKPLRHESINCGTESIPRTIDLLAIRPKGSGAGDALEVFALEPDQAVEPIVVVPQYSPAYSLTYRLRRPLRLARGTRLTIRSSSPGCSADLDFTTSLPATTTRSRPPVP